MPRERVVLTREGQAADQQAQFNRVYRRGFTYIAVGAACDVAAAILIVLGQIVAGAAVGVVGILIALLAVREFTRAGRAVEASRSSH